MLGFLWVLFIVTFMFYMYVGLTSGSKTGVLFSAGIILCILASIVVGLFYHEAHQKSLIKNDIAQWQVNPKTGETKLVFIKEECRH